MLTSASEEHLQLLRRAFGALVAQGAGVVAGYAAHVLLARWMGTGDYGLYTYVLATAALFSMVAAAGLPTSVLRFIPAYRIKKKWGRLRGFLRWSTAQMLGAGAILGLGMAGGAVVLAGDVPLRKAFVVGAGLVPLQAAFALASGMLCALHRASHAQAMPAWRHGILIVAAYGVFSYTGTLTGAQGLGLTAAAVLIVAGAQAVRISSLMPANVRRVAPRYDPGTWFKMSAPLMLVSGFILVINQTDVLMVGTLLSPREAGIYRAASKTATLVILFPTAIRVVVEPRLVELYAGSERRELQRMASMAVRWSFIPALGLALVLAVARVPVLRLFGSEFVVVRDVLLVLMGGQLLLAGAGVAGSLLNLTQFQRLAAYIFGGAAMLNIGLNALGILLAGMLGAAFATATTLCLLGVALWWAGRRQVGVDASIVDALRRGITSSTE